MNTISYTQIRNNVKLYLGMRREGTRLAVQNLKENVRIQPDRLDEILSNRSQPTFEEAWEISSYLEVPVQDLYHLV
ncbi:MAG: hypothetical protein KDD36_07915 [Flavobacteriales bacterium]|nr:hypothetical protein [Flavobacteriales bacterium]